MVFYKKFKNEGLVILFLCVSWCAGCGTVDDAMPPASGVYGNDIVLGYNESTREISGIYKPGINRSELSEDSCLFYFVGKFSGRKTNIISWRLGHRYPEVFGIMEVLDSVSFGLNFEREHVNCTILQGKSGIYTQSEARNWRFIRTVKADFANVYHAPDGAALDTIIGRQTILYITDKQIDWVKTKIGWLREQDLMRFPG